MNIVGEYPRLMNPDLAESYVGGPKSWGIIKQRKLVKPLCQGKGLTLYDRVKLDAAVDALRPEDFLEEAA